MLTPDPPYSSGSAYPNRPSSAVAARRSPGIASDLLDLVLAGQHLLPHEPPYRVADLTECRLVHGHLSFGFDARTYFSTEPAGRTWRPGRVPGPGGQVRRSPGRGTGGERGVRCGEKNGHRETGRTPGPRNHAVAGAGVPAARRLPSDQALACMLLRAGLPCSAALGSFSSALARTPASILLPRSLSTLLQYSNARCRTGSVTPLSRWPTTLVTSRSRAASSSTSRTMVPAWPKSSSSACGT